MELSGRNLFLGMQGDDVHLLHTELLALGAQIPPAEVDKTFFGPGTALAVQLFQREHALAFTGVVEEKTAELINVEFDRLGTPAPPERSYTVSGTIAAAGFGAVAGLAVAVVDRNVGADTELSTAVTGGDGAYQARYLPAQFTATGKTNPDLQVTVSSGANLLGVSEVRYNAGTDERIDVLLPADAAGIPSEFDALTGSLRAHYTGDLAALQEDATHQDITYLANKSGWDARAVAMAALSQQLAAPAALAAGSALAPEHFYALIRSGVAANPDAIYRLSPEAAAQSWKQAIAAGVMPASAADGLDAAAAGFAQAGALHSLTASALPGSDTLATLLTVSLGNNTEQQQKFAQLLYANRDDPAKLWDAAQQEFGPATTSRLQLDGRLALLTLDNAALIGRLHDVTDNQLTSPADLAARGFYQPQPWQELVTGTVPAHVPGSDDAERETNYTQLLAAQVRLSYPTAVAADLLSRNIIQLTDDPAVQGAVQEFLAGQAQNFDIGSEPVARFAARRELSIDGPVLAQVQRFQRVYQITPDDQSMAVLLDHGLDSAFAVVRYGTEALVRDFAAALGGEPAARAIAEKALQVHSAVLNVAGSYLTARSATPVGAGARLIDPGLLLAAAAGGTLVPQTPAHGGPPAPQAVPLQTPTLETLFGSLDFCSCDQCRSVLSPAAYLVDLLQFADRPVGGGQQNPQTVLLERRPDLAHLPLTCENTNTPLPYIDVVNETLEYFVTNGQSLTGYEGHDTGSDTPSEDLLASPQFVEDTAYAVLQKEHFPPPLPFHRPLELLRRHFQALGTSLADTLQSLRPSDEVVRADESSYGWRDILMERTGFSRPEHLLLTDGTIALADRYGFPAGTTETAAMSGLANAKDFARRSGLGYDDLVAILETGFINPAVGLIGPLRRFGLSFAALAQVKAGTLTDDALAALLPAGVGVQDVKDFVQANLDRAFRLIQLVQVDAAAPCSMDSYRLQYADPDPAKNALSGTDYVRLAGFIRLWRKLGWTIADTDLLLSALFPADKLPQHNDDGADQLALAAGFAAAIDRIGVARLVMDRLHKAPGKDLAKLVTLWAPIGTAGIGPAGSGAAGSRALYAGMFLGAAALALDPAFAPDEQGNVLTAAAETMAGHEAALRAAMGLRADEFALLAGILPGRADAALSLANVSSLYRHGWLAHALRISVTELLAIIRHTGLDPFAVPDPPNPPIIGLLDFLDGLRDAGLAPGPVLYLMFNDDLSGGSAPSDDQIHTLARTLRTAFAAVEADFAVVDDPTGDIARTRMSLIYGDDAAAFFFALLGQTFVLSVPYANPDETLPAAVIAAGGDRLGYDDLTKTLSWAGVMADAVRQALVAVPGVGQPFIDAVTSLADQGRAQTASFFARYPDLQLLYAGYLGAPGDASSRRATVMAALLSDLVRLRKEQQAQATLTSVLRIDPAMTAAITADPAVLAAASDPTAPALLDLVAVGQEGLSTSLYWEPAATGVPDATPPPTPTVDYGTAAPIPRGPVPGSAVSGRWTGYVEAPESGTFALAADTDAGGVSLTLDGGAAALDQDGTRWRTHAPLLWGAGQLIRLTLTVSDIHASLRLLWHTTGSGWVVIDGARLYPGSVMDDLRVSYVRTLKAASLGTAAKTTPNELAHLATDPDLAVAGAGWINALRDAGGPDAADEAELWTALNGLLTFARLKSRYSPDDERLLTALIHPTGSTADGPSNLAAATGWDTGTVEAVLSRLLKAPADLVHLDVFERTARACAEIAALGTTAASSFAAATNDPDAAAVAAFQRAVRARYSEEDWLAVVKPINDDLRTVQRNALVAYILRRFSEGPAGTGIDSTGIDTADKLFEYFLMDVEMDPCMLTSRIRHGLSSAQLFIDRCMMGLEPQVSADSLPAGEWDWMKRYRVWEANRKVFLWPENWLEPELRDDQSPFFKETMSELLQGDITEDRASTALMTYLMKLEEVAKLEPCAMFIQEQDPGAADDIVHVVARTSGAHRKYFYRRREYGYWTPWEQVKLDIEDNPVVPVV